MARMTKRQERRLRGLATRLAFQTDGAIEQISEIRFSWVRRRETEGSYSTVGGEVKTQGSAFDLWLEQPPEDPPREPDAREFSAEAAAERLLDYETWVRLS